jgi:type I restriction enzyme S subunit
MNKTRYRIKEIGKDFGDAPFGTSLKTKDYTQQGIPIIQGKNIVDQVFEWNRPLYTSIEKFISLTRSHCKAGDLVFPKIGNRTVGSCAIAKPIEGHSTFLLSTNMMKMSVNPDLADLKFVYYYFCQSHIRQKIISEAGGGAQPIFNFTSLKKFEIELPELPVQRRIADILSAYDDLIENNTRRIRILEQMAQVIYQEWFGRVDKESLPEGWELKPFSSLVDIDPSTPVDKQIEKPFVGMNALSETSMIIDSSLVEMRTGNSGAKFQNRDVLFPRITPSVENGKGAFVQFLKDGLVSIGSTEIIVFREKELNAEYIYFLSREHEFRGNAINSMVGASGRQRVQQKCFDSFMVAKPPKKLLEKFADTVSPIFKIIHTLALKNANLRQTRDLLLPRLVSGEVEV